MDSDDVSMDELRKIWDDEREFHDKISEIYPLDYDIWEMPSLDLIGDIIVRHNLPKVLDIGCGVGKDAVYMAKKGAVMWGNDISEKSIGKAKYWASLNRMDKRCNFSVGAIENMDFDSEFDIVLCKNTLHHMVHPEDILRKCARFLKPGGILVIHEPKSENPIAVAGRRFFIRITENEKAFRKNEIEHMISHINELQIINIKYFYIISPACQVFKFIFRNKTLMGYSFEFLDKVDSVLMNIPLFTKLSWIEVIVCRKTPEKVLNETKY